MKQQIKDVFAKTVKFLKDPTKKAEKAAEAAARKAEHEAKIKQIVEEAKNNLRSIPQMQNILANLPKDLQYKFGRFYFDSKEHKIEFNQNDGKFEFLKDFAISLALANQEDLGLTPNNLRDASLDEYYHVAKIKRIETLLLGVIVETELLKRPEFKNYKPSIDAYIYQAKLKEANGDEKRAIHNFVMAYWTNSLKEHVDEAVFEQNISSWYHWIVFNGGCGYDYYNYETNKTSAVRNLKSAEAIDAYLERLGIKDIADAEFFLNDTHYDALVRHDEFKSGYFNDLRDADNILKGRKYDVPAIRSAKFGVPSIRCVQCGNSALSQVNQKVR